MELPFELAQKTKAETPQSSVPFTSDITLHDVRFQYPTAEAPLFNGLDLEIKKGQRVAFIVATASGKSTLVDAISGYRPATHGQVEVNDVGDASIDSAVLIDDIHFE